MAAPGRTVPRVEALGRRGTKAKPAKQGNPWDYNSPAAPYEGAAFNAATPYGATVPSPCKRRGNAPNLNPT